MRAWLLLSGAASIAVVARAATPLPGGPRLWGLALPGCPFRAVSGLPCPFCGLTTGTVYLAHGAWAQSWHSSVLAPLFAAAVAGVAVYSVIAVIAAGRVADVRAGRRVWAAVIALAAFSWAVNLYRHFAG